MSTAYPPCFYRVSAKAVIVIDNKLLLVKEDTTDWELPGGGIEHHEAPVDALRREIREETGLVLDAVDESRLQAWATYDMDQDRPLLFLVYPAMTAQTLQPGLHGDVVIDLFDKTDLHTVPLVPYIEQFRQQLIQLAFPGSQ